MAPKGTVWLWKVPEGFPKGIHGAGAPEIDTVWDYTADGVLFEGALAWFSLKLSLKWVSPAIIGLAQPNNRVRGSIPGNLARRP